MCDGTAVPHQVGVRDGHHEVVRGVAYPGTGDRDFSVVGPFDHEGVDPIDGARACDHAVGVAQGAELVWSAFGVGSEFLAGRAVDCAKEFPVADFVHDLGPLIRRSKEDEAA